MLRFNRALKYTCAVVFVVLLSSYAFSQGQAPAALTFEVAAIKPAAPLNIQEIAQTGKIPKVGMTVEGTRVDIGYMSMADLLRTAYDVKPFQISGPDWINNERFDITARMPEGSTKEQAPQMLQALLAERFQLKVHRENRDNNVYALVVAKGGPKLKESVPEPETPAAAPTDEPPKSTGFGPNGGTLNINGQQMRVETRSAGAGGALATVTTPDRGTMKMNMSPDGQMQMEFSKMTMEQFAQTLTPMVDKPVVDMTELKGTYQAALSLSMADLLAAAAKSGALPAGAIPNNPFGARGAAPGQGPQAADPTSNSIFTSIQQLGLRLEPRKAPIEVIVVDSVQKTPTAN